MSHPPKTLLKDKPTLMHVSRQHLNSRNSPRAAIQAQSNIVEAVGWSLNQHTSQLPHTIPYKLQHRADGLQKSLPVH